MLSAHSDSRIISCMKLEDLLCSEESCLRIIREEMMSLTPARDEIEARRKREAIELCGKNRGSHDYIPIERTLSKGSPGHIERVTRLLCRVCFCNVRVKEILDNYPEVNF